MDVQYRAASIYDASVLASLNAQLICDEGHRNSMTVAELTERMSGWLKTEYQAFLFELEGKVIGYALYRLEPEYVYFRQLFLPPEIRRPGIARRALGVLPHNPWRAPPRVRI